MAKVAVEFYDHPSHELTVAGVTGTNGKTTTCFLLFAILAAAGRRPGLLGTIESRVGGERRPALRTTPEAIDVQRTLREMLEAGDRSCAMEATSHGAQLGRLAGVRFSALAFTNLSRDHLDFHGTLEQYFEAKRSLFVNDEPPPAALNTDDPHGRRLAVELRALGHERVITFGFGPEADVRAEELELGRDGAQLTAAGISLRTRLLGRFNVENVLGRRCRRTTARAARRGDRPRDRVGARRPGAFRSGRGGTAVLGGRRLRAYPRLAGDGSAHRAGAGNGPCDLRVRVRRRSRSRQATAHGRRRGGRRRRRDRHLRQPAQRGSSGRSSTRSRAGSTRRWRWSSTVNRRSSELSRRRGAGDVVLVAGKGHEQGQEAAGEILPFDDREVARQALRRLAART